MQVPGTKVCQNVLQEFVAGPSCKQGLPKYCEFMKHNLFSLGSSLLYDIMKLLLAGASVQSSHTLEVVL